MPQRNPVIEHDRDADKARNAVERFFNKIKRFRAVAIRCNKQDNNYPACAQLTSIRIWLRYYESVT